MAGIGSDTFFSIRQLERVRSLDNWLMNDHIESPAKGHAAIFIAGNFSRVGAAVHSEPMMDQPRLFFSIVPGDEAEVAQMKNKKIGTHLNKICYYRSVIYLNNN